MKIHHIGIVAESLELFLETFDVKSSEIEERVRDTNQFNDLFFMELEDTSTILEIVVPLNDQSTTHNFIKNRKIGLHHLGFKVNSISDAMLRHSRSKGHFPLGRYEINVESFGGTIKTAFVMTNGVLIEYVENVAQRRI
jgi:hypothetical protein